MNRVFPAFVFLAAACLVPVPAAAQPATRTGSVFVEASGFADIRRGPTTSVLNGDDDAASGTVAGGALALGVHLTERLSVRAEWTLSDTLSLDRSSSIFPLAIEDLAFRTLPQAGLLVPQRTTEERDVKAGFALLGYHLTAGRTSIELVGGVGLVNEQVTTIIEIQLPGFAGVPNFRTEYSASAHHAVAVVGADAAVSLTSHAALAPQVRVYALNGALQVRPGLGLRWTF